MTGTPPHGGREDILPLVPHLRGFARSLTGDVHAADDLVQDTIVLALQAWESFTPGTNLKA
jgi:RNA polymerase sigma-70 factor, ECF subfamily